MKEGEMEADCVRELGGSPARGGLEEDTDG